MSAEFRTSRRTFASSSLIAGCLAACCGTAHANVVILSAATSNMSCSAGVCTATAANAVLNAHDLEAILASSDVKVESGTIAGSIIAGVFSWASAHNLTFDANKSITVNHPVTVSGNGGLNLITNDGGTGGKFSFGATGNIVFWDTSSALTINGASYGLKGSIADLASAIASNPSGNFALAKSYDAAPDGAYSASPVATTYNGNFQGLGNTISRLQIRDTVAFGPDVGLFTHIGTNGSVQNLRMTLLNIRPRAGKSGGGLVGTNDGSLSGDSVAGTLTGPAGKAYVGMLAGTNNGVIDSSAASGTVSGSEQLHASTGGLVGRNEAGAISNSSSSGTVSRSYDLGGLVGTMDAGTISNSSSSANISLGGNAAGGLVGRAYGTISRSHATGDLAALGGGGGLVGAVESTGMIDRCYATGNVSGPFVGGLVAGNEGSISKSFATGNVDSETGKDSDYAGGLVGLNTASVSDSYATGSASGGEYAGGFVGWNGVSGSTTGVVAASYSTGPATGATFNGGFIGDNRNASGQGYTHTYWNTTTSGTTQAIGTGNAAPITGLTT